MSDLRLTASGGLVLSGGGGLAVGRLAQALKRFPVTVQRNLEAGFVYAVKPESFANTADRDAFFAEVQADGGDIYASRDLAGTEAERLPLAVLDIDTTPGSEKLLLAIRLAVWDDGSESYVEFSRADQETIYLWVGGPGNLKQPPRHLRYGREDVFEKEVRAAVDFHSETIAVNGDAISTIGTVASAVGPHGLPATGFGTEEGGSGGNSDGALLEAITTPSIYTLRFWHFWPSVAGTANKKFVDQTSAQEDGDFSRQTGAVRLTHRFTTTDGVWDTVDGVTTVAPADQWNHLALRVDLTNVANVPDLFVNKTARTMQANTAPVGSHNPSTEQWNFCAPFNANSGRVSFALMRAEALSDAWKDAEFDMLAAPLTVASIGAPATVQHAGFAQADWVDPGVGYTGDPDPIPGGDPILLQGNPGLEFGSLNENQFYANMIHRGTAKWAVFHNDAVSDGFDSGVYPPWAAVQKGWIDRDGNWLVNPPSITGLTQANGGSIFKGGASHPDDDPNSFVVGKFIALSWDGGTGEDLELKIGAGSVTVVLDEPGRIVFQLPSVAANVPSNLTWGVNLANCDMTTVTNIRAEEVEFVDPDYVSVETAGEEVSKIFRDTFQPHYHSIRMLDQLGQFTSARSLDDLSTVNSVFRTSGNEGGDVGSSRFRTGYNIQRILESFLANDWVPWIELPHMIGCPVAFQNASNVQQGDGSFHVKWDIWSSQAQEGSFAKVAASEFGEGVWTLSADGVVDYDTVNVPTEGLDTGFDFTFTDLAGDTQTARFSTRRNATFWQRVAHEGMTLNAEIIRISPEWRRSAGLFLDALVAASWPTDKKIILDSGNEGVWNTGGAFNGIWTYFNNLGNELNGGGSDSGAAFVLAQWMFNIRQLAVERAIGPYNLCFTFMGHMVNPSTTTDFLVQLAGHLSDLGVDPADYIKPGHTEPAITTYTNNLFAANGDGASGATNTTDNDNFWFDRIKGLNGHTYQEALDAAANWHDDMVNSHGQNAKFIFDRWVDHQANAAALGTRVLGAYEGGNHNTTLPGTLESDQDFLDFYRDLFWGDGSGSQAWSVLHAALNTEFSHQIIVSNYGMAGSRSTDGPWQEGPLYTVATSPMEIVFREVGKQQV